MITRTSTRARKRLGTFGFLGRGGRLGQTANTAPLGIGTGQTWSGYSYSPQLQQIGLTALPGVTAGANFSTAPAGSTGSVIPAGVPVSTGVGTVTSGGSSGLSSTQWLMIAAIGLGAIVLLWPSMKAPSTP